jgi:hypothetical protein
MFPYCIEHRSLPLFYISPRLTACLHPPRDDQGIRVLDRNFKCFTDRIELAFFADWDLKNEGVVDLEEELEPRVFGADLEAAFVAGESDGGLSDPGESLR